MESGAKKPRLPKPIGEYESDSYSPKGFNLLLHKMDREALSKARAEIIEKFINLEWVINAIISQHYLRRVDYSFVLDFLYDEYCSFTLKRRIIEKIVKDIDSRQIQDLNRLNTIRNLFAHCGQEIFECYLPAKIKLGRCPTCAKAINFWTLKVCIKNS